MLFNFVNLDSVTRNLMLEELESDIAVARVYVSRRALPGTEVTYYDTMRTEFATGDAASLTTALATSGIFAVRQSDGKLINVADSASALGDGQFVAYYSRAVCLRAIAEAREIEIYRGQSTFEHRVKSDALIGTRPDPADLLDELRTKSLDPWNFPSVGKVNSGIAIKLL